MFDDQRTDFGRIELRISDVLKEKKLSKNRICRDLDIPRSNFNRYCRGDFQRIDTGLLCKLCWYLNIGIDELVVYHPARVHNEE